MTLALNPQLGPFELFADWFAAAKQRDPEYYNGMAIATVNKQQQPSNRIVLLKDFNASGFVFFSNYLSRKGQQLANNQKIAATFWWSAVEQQIRIEGEVEQVSAAESDDYFFSRATGSQIAAVTSAQSQAIDSIEALETAYQATEQAHQQQPVSRPEHWGGYRIKPNYFEFWQGRPNRLHHRLTYTKTEQAWKTQWLQP